MNPPPQPLPAGAPAQLHPVTALPGRDALIESVAHLPPGNLIAAIHIDLCNFGLVNQLFGPRRGNEFLAGIARLLGAGAPGGSSFGHLWADEFALLFSCDSPASAIAVAEGLRAALASYSFQEGPLSLPGRGSFGVAVRTRGADADKLLADANLASGRARRAGTNQVYLYSGTGDEAETGATLRIAQLLAEGRLEIAAQPILRCQENGAVVKAELLLRRKTEEGLKALSEDFVMLAERFGLSVLLDRYVLDQAFEWMRTRPPSLERLERVAINLSGSSLSDAAFQQDLLQRVRFGAVPPNKLLFEVTETAAVAQLEQLQALIGTLGELGCTFALDDFGYGLCSFAYLQALDVREVKIDGRFIKAMVNEALPAQIVQALHTVARAAGKKTTAEFVEDRATFDALRKIGVDYVQGWLFSLALPLREFDRYVREQ